MTQAPPPPSQPVKPHRGVVILVLGLLGIFVCFIIGIVAWVMANQDLAEMEAGRMDREGEGMTKAGKICGIIGVIIQLLVPVIYFVVVVLILGAGVAAGAAGG